MPTESKRQMDWNGFMEVRDNPISKVGVFPYLGSEIPGAEDPDRIYYVYRPAEELARQETIDSFKLMPFIDEHEVLGKSGMPAERKGVQGVIGEQVYFDEPYLRANLKIHSSAAQSLIAAGKVELSPCYGCEWAAEVGTFEGKPYQYVQRNIVGNHLALVEEGRTGPDVAVQDHRKFTLDSKELLPMEFTPEQIAQLKALIAEMMGTTGDETPEEKAAKEKAAADEAEANAAADEDAANKASDAEGETDKDETDYAGGDEERAAEKIEEIVEEIKDAIEEIEEASEDLTKASDAKSRKLAKDRMVKAKGKLAAAKGKRNKLAADSAARKAGGAVVSLTRQVAALTRELTALKKPAQDSASLLGVIADRDQLYGRVSQFTGAFDHTRMDATQLAAYACDKLSIKCAKGHEPVALDAWLQGRKPEHETIHAKDSKESGSALKAWGAQ